jgi:hypothetical protein
VKRSAGFLRAKRVLAAAVAPVALAVISLPPARAEIKAFSPNESDWLNPINWNPAGVPGAGDTALIIGGTADMSLTSSLTIQSIDFRGGQSRRLGNATTGSSDATLSLTGDSTGTFVSVRTPTTFTIEGANIDPTGTGTGRIGLQISNNGTWATGAGAKLILKPNILQAGSTYSFSKIGAGEVDLQGHCDIGGTLTISRGPFRFSTQSGDLISAAAVHIDPGASLVLDNSKGINSYRINNSAAVQMYGGQVQLIGAASIPMTETLGQLQALGTKGDSYVVSSTGAADLRFASLQRSAGRHGAQRRRRQQRPLQHPAVGHHGLAGRRLGDLQRNHLGQG